MNWKKNTAVFMACQGISLFGSSLVQYAITWHITLETESGVYAMLSILCGFLPMLFLSPFAGVWADRYHRKKLIMLADGSIAVCTLLLAFGFKLGYGSIGLLLGCSVVRSLGSAVQTPCIGAILPDIVPEQHLTRVNGLNSAMQSVILLASPMLSATLLNIAPIESIFYIDVVTAALAIGIMSVLLHVPKQKKAETAVTTDALYDLKQGLSYIKSHRYLTLFFIFCAVLFFMAAPVAFLTPLQVTRNYGGDVTKLSLIEITFSIGMMLGGLLMASWGGFRNRIYTMSAGTIIMAVCTIMLGLPVPFWIYLLLMGVFGLAMPAFNTSSMVLLQEKVDSAYMGRVFGIMTMISSSMMPLGMLVFGPLADVIVIEWLLIFTGIIMLAASILLYANPHLAQAGIKENEKKED